MNTSESAYRTGLGLLSSVIRFQVDCLTGTDADKNFIMASLSEVVVQKSADVSVVDVNLVCADV